MSYTTTPSITMFTLLYHFKLQRLLINISLSPLFSSEMVNTTSIKPVIRVSNGFSHQGILYYIFLISLYLIMYPNNCL
ncbi:hypothetical protein K439DRAFT_571254 [Ramaria rubella]|nr:hypothetical protein K439DRAFT_571254 [Ramaria rubella]